MFISVIVVTYNRADLLGDALASLVALEVTDHFSFEIIVVDDASTDNTRAVVEKISYKAKVPIRYYMEDGKGVARARNRGIKEASGEWIAFFDDDQIAEPCWLKELISVALRSNSSCVGGRIQLRLPENTKRLSHVCRALLGTVELGDKPIPLPGKSLPGTGNVIVKRELFELVGPFDESFTKGCEDADLFRRIRRRGYTLWYNPKAIARHIIPRYRLKEQYLTWGSIRDGVNYAYLDYKENGKLSVVYLCIFRIGHALLMHLPRFCLSRLRKDPVETMGHRCLLAKTYGYAKEALFLVAPKLFAQKRFFSWLEFRGERQTFSTHSEKLRTG